MLTTFKGKLAYVSKETAGERIRRARTEAKLTQQDLADAAGVSRAAVALWENGDTKSLKPNNLFKIARRLNKPAEWLATGQQAAESNSLWGNDTEAGPDLGQAREVPIVGNTQGGPDAHWEDLGYPTGYGDEYIEVFVKDPTAYALRVRGNSMAPRIKEGEVIVASRNAELVSGEDVIIKLKDGQVMVKQLTNKREDYITIESVSGGERMVFALADILFIHAVIGIHPASHVKKR